MRYSCTLAVCMYTNQPSLGCSCICFLTVLTVPGCPIGKYSGFIWTICLFYSTDSVRNNLHLSLNHVGWMGLWATWFSGQCPCPWQRYWNQMILNVPSNPKGSMILMYLKIFQLSQKWDWWCCQSLYIVKKKKKKYLI